MKVLISSCLAGVNCVYHGKNNELPELRELLDSGQAVLACPEVLGGLPVPRDPCEIFEGRVVSSKGADCTEQFRKGAEATLALCRRHKIRYALLKFRSPSCGSGLIYDGTFSHTFVEGDGVAAALLKENGIQVFHERQLGEFFAAVGMEREKERGDG